MASVINIPGNQVLAQPVTSYYKGKAMRQQIAKDQFSLDTQEERFETEKDTASRDERRVKTYEDQVDLAVTQYEDKVGRQKMLDESGFFVNLLDSGLPPEETSAQINKFISAWDDADDRKAELLETGADGWDQSELANLYALSNAALGRYASGETDKYAAKDTYVGEDGQEYHMWYGKDGQAHKTTIPAKSASGASTDFEPPNNGERAAALAAVEDDDRLSDLPKKQRVIASEIVANEARQIQATLSKSYQEALKMAIAGINTKDVSGWISSNTELDLGSGALTDNEFVQDGVVYVRDENGNWSRK